MLSIDTQAQADLVRKLSILFVEDDAEVCENMARYLERRVAKVHTAQNGLMGLNSFREIHPDLVISDIRMGGMDGLAMCRAIRETDPDFPVIIISAHNESDVLLSSIDLGITKFIVKPVDTKALMESIASVAQSLEQQRNLESQLQQASLVLNEADYESESIKNYISSCLEGSHHDELTNLRHLNIPKLGVSGDFYSVAKHGDDLYVMLADGAGHGLSAVIPALQMPGVFQQQAARGFSLLSIAAEMNRSLNAQHFAGHFVATTLLRTNSSERFIEVLNCGNPPVFVFDEEGSLLHTGDSKSPALGVVGDAEFSAEVERFRMNQSARIYLFTDGLPDTLQLSGTGFDQNMLQLLFGNVADANVFDAVSAQIEKSSRQGKVDDVTLLEIRFDCDAAPPQQIEIPLDPEQQQEAETPVALDQMTMLYVEDDDMMRDYLSLYLNRRLGMVHVARDGKEGLALFRKHRPQIVLTDIRMPQMDGLSMAAEIRKLDRDVPIIVTSGADNAADAEKMFELGVSRFQMKPLDPRKLAKSIQDCIRQANAVNGLRLSSSVFQTSSLAVVTADQDKRIVAVNRAFSRITGYNLDELIGHSPTLLSAGRHDANYILAIWRVLDASGSWSGEFLCQHKNGTTTSEWLTVNAVKAANGGLTGYHFIFSDINERKMNEEKVQQLTQIDNLTRLPNRTVFTNKFNELLAKAKLNMDHLALVNVKLDHFGNINHVFGLSVGDEVINAVGQILLRSIGESDVVCRMGGVEFSVLMLRKGGRAAIEQAVVELFAVLNRPVDVLGHRIQLRVNLGVSSYPADGETHDELIKGAHSAMGQVQEIGMGGYRFFDKSISQQEERRAILQQGIKPGLQQNEFYMLYQPKFSLSQSRVVGAEALVRWNHPTLGLVSPVEFIPLAESNGSVIEMTEWIVATVCAQLAGWRRQGLSLVPVSINISPVHFWRGDLVGTLQSGLKRWDISPLLLPIEVTEGVVMEASDKTLQMLGQLRALGFHLSVDDFGTGYSSLKYLKDMPISELKIDRSFVIEIPEEGQPDDLSKTAIIRAIIQLATEFNLSLVAEGVETEHQKQFLQQNGCDVIQGYLFSRPIPADDFAVKLSRVNG